MELVLVHMHPTFSFQYKLQVIAKASERIEHVSVHVTLAGFCVEYSPSTAASPSLSGVSLLGS